MLNYVDIKQSAVSVSAMAVELIAGYERGKLKQKRIILIY